MGVVDNVMHDYSETHLMILEYIVGGNEMEMIAMSVNIKKTMFFLLFCVAKIILQLIITYRCN
jgi:hypothetical protein